MDPLSLLRDFCVKGKLDKVKKSGGRIEFGDEYSFDEKMPTAFKSQRGPMYTLQAIYSFIANPERDMYPHYLQWAMTEQVDKVARVDVKEITDYLFGNIETCAKIIPPDKLPDLVPPPTKRSSEVEGDHTQHEPKRQKTECGSKNDEGAEEVGDVHQAKKNKKWTIENILHQERQLRDRNAQLLCPGKDFTFAAELSRKHLSNYRQKTKSTNDKSRTGPVTTGAAVAASKGARIPVRPSNRYERELPQNQAGNLAGPQFADMGVSLYGLRGADHLRSNDAGNPAQPGHVSTSQHNRPLDQTKRSSHRSSHRHESSGRAVKPPHEAGMPIILIPPGLSAKINMYNARLLLEDAKYIPAGECRAKNPHKKDADIVQRSFGKKRPVKYQLMERPPSRNSKDWNRVVAVVSQGVKWQFKDFPFKGADTGNMMETFTKIQGFYFAFHNEELSPLVKSWNVHTIVIHKDNRHNDITVMQEFFRKLDDFLATKKARTN